MASTITRLTLFPPAGNRIVMAIDKWNVENGFLSFADKKGIIMSTTLPWAIEEVPEGHQEAPFNDKR